MENLSNISVIRDVLTRHGFPFSKGLGAKLSNQSHRLSAHGRIGKCAAGLGND